MLTTQDRSAMSILIVDDEDANRWILGDFLRNEGYRVKCAANGREALALAASERIDLILLDIFMPDIDGYEVCRRLKQDASTRDIPVIFVTIMWDPSDERKGLEMGAVDYIKKPFCMSVVKARVETHLSLKHQRDRLANLSAIDGLTGIANRRSLDEHLQRHWRYAVREAKPLSFIMIDIDCFKIYNDTYGHPAGDRCLKRLATLFEKGIKRPGDIAARYGGEEFALVLPETGEEGLRMILQRLENKVRELKIPNANSVVVPYVTVSMGGATLYPGSRIPPGDLVARSDELLYQAKAEGRNRFKIGALPASL